MHMTSKQTTANALDGSLGGTASSKIQGLLPKLFPHSRMI